MAKCGQQPLKHHLTDGMTTTKLRMSQIPELLNLGDVSAVWAGLVHEKRGWWCEACAELRLVFEEDVRGKDVEGLPRASAR